MSTIFYGQQQSGSLRSLWLLLLLGVLSPLSSAAASLYVENTKLTVPAKIEEKEVHVQFYFSNTGDKAVTILEVKTSCHCTSARLDKNVYLPGESGEVDVTISLDKVRQNIHSLIILKTSDAQNPAVELGILVTPDH